MTETADRKPQKEVADNIDQIVAKGQKALTDFLLLDQSQVDYIVAKASVAALDAHGKLARHAVEETQRGVFEDKATKNLFACEHVTNYMRDIKTVGVIEKDEANGLTYIAEPVGVVFALTPTTNPTSTAIFKALIALKTRNPIIFSFHPSANLSSRHAAEIVYQAAIQAGAPDNCIQWVEEPTIEKTNQLMNHDGIATILATGGNAMVKSAYSCGKPALGVGAGNVPAYVEKTAKIKQAAHDIILSASFDNGMICASESTIIIDKEIYTEFVDEMKSYHTYVLEAEEKEKLELFCFGAKAYTANVIDAYLNPDIVGMSAEWIAEQAGFSVPEGTDLLAVEVNEIGPNEPMTREKLSPIIAIIKAKSTEDGLNKSAQMVEFNGLGHSAAIHTEDEELSVEFGRRVNAMRIIWNAPSTFGGIGDVYNAFIPSLTLGCGSYGGNSVGDNINALNLLNIKKVGRRRNNMQWFKVPPKIYFERNSLQYLKSMPGIERIMIIADKSIERLGFVQKVITELDNRRNKVQIDIFTAIEPDPDIKTVEKGAQALRDYEPDTIIAIGGGSVMDAAKVMWLFYERPDIDFRDLVQKFLDIRKRAFRFPQLGSKAQLVCIPTTSGTGSEVTPFAVISDKENKRKYPLADYSLLPSVAIVDTDLVMTVPAHVAADTGMDVLTHAIEAYVSVMASDYTDGLALQAIKLTFDNLEKAVYDADFESREKVHNAATLAGMAFGNAFLGICHSMAHTIGGVHGTVHGRTNAILLPYVIRYNGTRPAKTSNWPKYTHYCADERYLDIARYLGLPATTAEEGVESLAHAIYDLGEKVGIKMNFKDQAIDEKAWKESTEEMAFLAYEDQCTPVNPRLALVSHLQEIMNDAYLGYKENPGRIK